DQSTGLEGEAGDDGRQAELVQRDGADGDATEDQTSGATGAEAVGTEASDTRKRVGEVSFVGALELLDEVGTQHLAHHLLRVRSSQVTGLELAQPAVNAYPGRRADLAVEVGPAALHQSAQEGLDRQSRG